MLADSGVESAVAVSRTFGGSTLAPDRRLFYLAALL